MQTAKFILFILISWVTALPGQQQIRFTAVDRPVVETRLKDGLRKNEDRKNQLEQFFREAGCNGERLSNQKVKGSNLPNVICTLAGSSDSVIIVGAHFDNQGAGTGIVDNWSGASLLPSLYQSLSEMPRKHTFRFIGFTDEEKGLVGSAFYAKSLTKEEIPNIKAMVNLDTLGLGPAALWLSTADKGLATGFYTVAGAMQLSRNAVNVDGVGSTDSESFRLRKIPSLTVHSLTQKTWSILHTPDDKVSALNLDDYYQTYRLLVGYLVYLDE
jgi:Iap family predicted aminopeptidase